MELGPEAVSLLEMFPHFRGCYVQASMELGHEDVSLYIREVSSLFNGSLGPACYTKFLNEIDTFKSLVH